jgi:hypothetical protein
MLRDLQQNHLLIVQTARVLGRVLARVLAGSCLHKDAAGFAAEPFAEGSSTQVHV